MNEEQKKYPKVAAGVYVFNKAGKIFLMRGNAKFQNQYFVPGGHIDWGESAADCALREVKEETGLSIYDLVFLRPVEFIFDRTYSKEKHFISLGFIARTDNEEDDVRLDGREATDYIWLLPEEVLTRDDIEAETKKGVAVYVEQKRSAEQLDEYKQGWQRALADYNNLQKEVSAKRGEWAQMSEQMILEEFIPVYDNFKKAFSVNRDSWTQEQKNWATGIGYIMKQFGDVLKNHKVEEIKTVGEVFDPKLHETAGEEESEEMKSGTVVREVEGGYTMGGRVVKVARVILAK